MGGTCADVLVSSSLTLMALHWVLPAYPIDRFPTPQSAVSAGDCQGQGQVSILLYPLLLTPGTLFVKRLLSRTIAQVIAKAKVPIVKFEDAETGYAFDVSFDVANGPEVRVSGKACFTLVHPLVLAPSSALPLVPQSPPSPVLLLARDLRRRLRMCGR